MRRILLSTLLFFTVFPVSANIQLTDLAGRSVVLEKPAKNIVLGEGRFIAALGVLGIEKPVDLIAGMMNDFRRFDPASFSQFEKAYPEIDQVPSFGHTSEDSVSVEKIILLNPDLAIFGLNGHGPGARSKHIVDRMEAASIPILFIDFRQNPIQNTPESMMLIAEALGYKKKGLDFSKHYKAEVRKIESRVKTLKPEEKPNVLIELRAGKGQDCCLTVGKGMFADMVELAGGISLAKDTLPGPVGSLSSEYVITSNFDIYIGTAIAAKSGGNFIAAGTGVGNQAVAESLRDLLEHRNFVNLPAVKNGKAYALWHHFYNSPLNLYAIQKMATWFHPELFKDINPEQTLNEVLKGFNPIKLHGVYAAGMK